MELFRGEMDGPRPIGLPDIGLLGFDDVRRGISVGGTVWVEIMGVFVVVDEDFDRLFLAVRSMTSSGDGSGSGSGTGIVVAFGGGCDPDDREERDVEET